MYSKLLALAALASTALCQTQNLTATLGATPELSNLTTYVSLFPELLTSLGSASNITILAPSNEAFAKLLSGPAGDVIKANDTATIQALLTYHVLNGTYAASDVQETPAFVPTLLTDTAYTNVTGGQAVGAVKDGENVIITSGLGLESTVTQADVQFEGGVVHIIDTVLTLPQNISSTAIAANLTAAAGALTTAELVETVDTTADLTVFVPSNAAFEAIGSALPNLSVEALTSILSYHVVAGAVLYSSLLSNTSVETLGGGNITVTIIGEDVFINSAKVITPNVLVANGVVHVIDNVLNPNATSATPDPAAETQTPAFAGASSAPLDALTSGVPTPTAGFGGAGTETTPTAESTPPPSSTTNAAAALSPGHVGAVAVFLAYMMV